MRLSLSRSFWRELRTEFPDCQEEQSLPPLPNLSLWTARNHSLLKCQKPESCLQTHCETRVKHCDLPILYDRFRCGVSKVFQMRAKKRMNFTILKGAGKRTTKSERPAEMPESIPSLASKALLLHVGLKYKQVSEWTDFIIPAPPYAVSEPLGSSITKARLSYFHRDARLERRDPCPDIAGGDSGRQLRVLNKALGRRTFLGCQNPSLS